MKIRSNVIILLTVLVFVFSIFVILLTLYRSSLMLNRYFPGFFVYHTKVINIYDIPEWWAGKTSGIPIRAILVALNDTKIKTTKDFWDEVLRNLNREIEYKVEYEVNDQRFITFVKAQRFEVKDFVAFSLFWQVSGFLLLMLGLIIYLGNRSPKGEIWLLANVLTGLNFLTTPSSSLLSDVFIITFIERLTFSLFPVSMVWLFLNFPLVKFRKQTRLIITSVVGSIGLSFLVISLLGYTDNEEIATFQEMYYFYPGIGGLFAVFSPIYDYVRTRKHNLYQFSKALLPLVIGALLFILIPSILAILTTVFGLPSYYIPLFIVGYPILVISTVMTNSLKIVREISINLSVIVIISLIFTFIYSIVFSLPLVVSKGILFLILLMLFFGISIPVFGVIRRLVGEPSVGIYKEQISGLIEKFKNIDRVSKFIIFINRELSKILGFSFSKFVSYKLIPRDIRKTLFLMSDVFLSKEELEECCNESRSKYFQNIIEKSKYVMTVKYGNRFFGIILLGKKITTDVLTKKEIELMNVISKVIGNHINSLAKIMLQRKGKEILKQRSYGVSNILLRSTILPMYVDRQMFSIKTIFHDSLDKPTVYKIKDTPQGVFFCMVWILPESIHTLTLASIVKGIMEEYFYKGRINIHRLPREIRNVVAVSPVEVDTNILCGVVKNNSNNMDVVNDGKTSIVLVTKNNAVIPMPVHKRFFNFSKIKEGDRFFFINGEEIATQIQEIKEKNVGKIDPNKFFYELPDKLVIEIKFNSISNQ